MDRIREKRLNGPVLKNMTQIPVGALLGLEAEDNSEVQNALIFPDLLHQPHTFPLPYSITLTTRQYICCLYKCSKFTTLLW